MHSKAAVFTDVQVRPARLEDMPGVLDIYNDAVLTTTASYDYEPRSLEHRFAWFKEHETANYPVFVAEQSGQIIGWSALNRFHDRMGYRFTVENSVYVAAAVRGRGVGTLLMTPLIHAAQTRSFHAILAVIDAANEASVRLHARF